MQMLSQQKANRKRIKKSHLLIIGSFLVFFGVILLSSNHLSRLRDDVFSQMKIAISDSLMETNVEVVEDSPVADNLSEQESSKKEEAPAPIDYSKYLGVLEIPRIGLKRGFYGTDSKYNNIQYNVTMVSGSRLPDVVNGNLILMAHSGDAYISYFAYLYRLQIGNDIYVTYQNQKYHYKIVNIYTVPKTGNVVIKRNYNKTTLTLITCTKNDDYSQTIYISELI